VGARAWSQAEGENRGTSCRKGGVEQTEKNTACEAAQNEKKSPSAVFLWGGIKEGTEKLPGTSDGGYEKGKGGIRGSRHGLYRKGKIKRAKTAPGVTSDREKDRENEREKGEKLVRRSAWGKKQERARHDSIEKKRKNDTRYDYK